jgi:hypothetical protein
MTAIEIERVLLGSALLNYAILLIWLGAFIFSHEWMYRLHTRWFKIPVETFDAVHYGAMAVYKVGILLLNLAPMIAIFLVFGRSRPV